VTALELSADESQLVSGSRTGRISRWSARPKACRWAIGGRDQPAYDFAFVDEGKRLVVAGQHGLELWDLQSRRLAKTWAGGLGPWENVAAASQTNTVIAGNAIGDLVAWDLKSNAPLARWTSPAFPVWDRVAFSPDGHRFAAVAWDRLSEAWIFDLEEPEWSNTLPAFQSKCVTFSPNGEQLGVAWMDDALLYRWRELTEQHRFQGHSNTLSDLAFSPDGANLATVSHDRKLRLWDIETGAVLYTIVAHRDWVRSVAFAPDGQTLVTAGDDGLVRLWHTDTGQLLLELPNGDNDISKARFSPDGRCIVCYTDNNRIVIFDAGPSLRTTETRR
jgi:WD40 repeat protein